MVAERSWYKHAKTGFKQVCRDPLFENIIQWPCGDVSRCKAVETFAPIHFKPTTTWSQISDLVSNILLRFRATHSIELTVFKWKIISNQNKSKTIPYTTHIYLCIIIVGFIYTLRIGQIKTCLQAHHALTGIQICIAGAIFIYL